MSDTATKQDIQMLRQDMAKQGETLRSEMREQGETLRSEMREQGETLRSEMREAFDDLTALLQTFMMQVDERFSRIEEEQRQIRKDIQRLFDLCDKIIKKQEIADEERILVGHQLDRLDRWTHELAEKIGYTLQA